MMSRNSSKSLMFGSSHIRSNLIGVEHPNCCLTLDVIYFLLFGWANSIKMDLHICNLWTGQFVSYRHYQMCPNSIQIMF